MRHVIELTHRPKGRVSVRCRLCGALHTPQSEGTDPQRAAGLIVWHRREVAEGRVWRGRR